MIKILLLFIMFISFLIFPIENLKASQARNRLNQLIIALKKFDKNNISSIKDIEKIMNLDFLGKRAINLYWNKMTLKQREKFLLLFKNTVRKLAYKRSSKYFKKNKYRIISENKIEKKDFLMSKKRETLKLSKLNLLVNYKTSIGIKKELLTFLMYEQDFKFIVFDIELINGSLIKDYRNQFVKIIRSKGSVDELIKVLQDKLNK